MISPYETDQVKLGGFITQFYSATEIPFSVRLCDADTAAAAGENHTTARTFTVMFRDEAIYEVSLCPEHPVPREKLDACEYIPRLGFSDPVKNGFVILKWKTLLASAEEYISAHIKEYPKIILITIKKQTSPVF